MTVIERLSGQHAAIYKALVALLEERSIARLQIENFESGEDVTVGLHAGYGDGDLVVGASDLDDPAMHFQFGIDVGVARDLAAAFLAWANWCDSEREKGAALKTPAAPGAAR